MSDTPEQGNAGGQTGSAGVPSPYYKPKPTKPVIAYAIQVLTPAI